MIEENYIKIKGKVFDLNKLKAGLLRKDIKDKDLLSIFDNINQYQLVSIENDEINTQEWIKDTAINNKELDFFFEQLLLNTRHHSISKGAISVLGSMINVENLTEDLLFKFLSLLEENSEKIESCITENYFTRIEYKDGLVLELQIDGEERELKKIRVKEDENMKNTLKIDMPYQFMSDRDKVFSDLAPALDADTDKALYKEILSIDENDVNEKVLNYIDILKSNINFDDTQITDKELLQKAKSIVINKLDSCKNNKDYKQVLNILKEVCKIQTKTSKFYQCIVDDTPNCEIDTVAYQGHIGDCWLLSTLLAISECGKGGDEAGKKYLKKFISFDKNTQAYTVKLEGGKIQYTFTLDELKQNSDNLSYGEVDLTALEYGIQKYANEYGRRPNKTNRDLNGGVHYEVFDILEGENSVGFKSAHSIDLDIKNIDKLKGVRIWFHKLNKEDLKKLQGFNGKAAILVGSKTNHEGHQYWIHNITDNKVEVKESHNSGQYAEYTWDDFIKNYGTDNACMFIP